MDAIERDDLRMWWLFRLADAWDSSSSDVEQVDEDRYVQWAGYGAVAADALMTAVEILRSGTRAA